MYLERMNDPKDLKRLSIAELTELTKELREALLQKLSSHGGHIGPNLGIVEVTTALHYVFDSPIDKIVYDVSHQSYVHKMLTGRKEAFLNPERYDDVSGYSCPQESEHDFFEVGHTSTSISLACGLVRARDLKGDHENVIALIGDGSLSGGEAYEGLNNAAEAGTNMIIVVNDNEQSIAENHGGLYQNLKQLRESNGTCECNFFRAMGLDYVYVEDGHDMEVLIATFESIKGIDHPIVVHVHTTKGKGFVFAEKDRELYHAGPPFDRETGKYLFPMEDEDSYENRTSEYLMEAAKKDHTVAVITSATPLYGLTKERRAELGKQYIDVGIAEEHAVALISGMARNGAKPVYPVYSTFLQRTYDQLSQDLCINNNPALLLVFLASVYGMTDISHLGIFDIPLISNIPNLVYLAPTCKEEYFAMLSWGMNQTDHPVAIRVPANGYIVTGVEDTTDYSKLNRYQVTRDGERVAVIALGDFYQLGEELVEAIEEVAGVKATLINPRFITGVDEELLNKLKESHELVITLEDGILEGGFGEKIARFYGTSDMKVKNYGIRKSFPDRYDVEVLLKENGITVEQMVQDTKQLLEGILC